MNTFSIQEAITFGWDTFKKDKGFFALVTLALVVFSGVVNALTGHGSGIFALVGWLIGFAASTVVTIAYARLALSSNDGHHVGWEGLWAPQHFWKMFGTTLIVGIVTIVGFILFVIPGIIAIVMLCFTQFLVVDKGLGPIPAIKESYRLSKGHWLQIFLFLLVLLVMNIIGALLILVGLLVSIPVSIIAFAHVYRKISALKGEALPSSPVTIP